VEIAVILKQVPATESMVEIADDGVSIRSEDIKWVINPYDEYAVEEALRIKADHGGTVTVYSIGTDKAVEALRTAMAMGADKGVLVNDPALANNAGLAAARALAAAIKQNAYDLVIAGMRAVDDDQYLVGPAVAEYLGLPHIAMVVKAEIDNGKIRCDRTVEGGTMSLEASLPVLITAQKGLNEPRYASLPGIMKAKKKPLDVLSLADIGLAAEELQAAGYEVTALVAPPQREAGQIIEGESAEAKVDTLVRLLHEEAKVI
jgi:electron transfer flavoprotein beta subunit